MPRPRVKDEDRKRVARACDTCKRRKEKCDGNQPCLLCKRRGREPECSFTDAYHRRTTATGRSSPTTPSRSIVTLKDALNDSNDAEIAIESLLTLSGNRSAPKSPVPMFGAVGSDGGGGGGGGGAGGGGNGGHREQQQDGGSRRSHSHSHHHDSDSHAPVPKLARLLRDGHGKFIFVGDSSNLAFVQNIRRLVKVEIGDCPLSSDPLRHAMVERIPVHDKSFNTRQVQKPGLTDAEDLVKHYLLASSGVIDLFDPEEIIDHLSAWVRDSAAETDYNSSIYYLVLAIGALNRLGSSSDQAELYFCRGRELIVSNFMDDPSVLTIQAYVLITFYMLTATRRNGAFMLLGIAVRAAYALGLHRSDISRLFDKREKRTRERVWKSLRVLDLYMSASLGRPSATSEVDGGSISWDGMSRDYEDIRMARLNSSAMLRICFILERIMNEVYCRREVSVQLVESISRQYRDWTLQLPAGLQVDGLDQKPGTPLTLRQTIGVAHLKESYYWSIILLTRPFLIFMVSSKIKGRVEDHDHQSRSVTLTLSEACIDAALRSIEIATDLMHTPAIPRRLFAIANATFVSAMVIGFAIFGDFDKSFPLLSSISQAEANLSIMAKDDPSARRYETITGYLRQAAGEHIRRRDQKQIEKRRQDINNIFGDPVNKNLSQPKLSPQDQTQTAPDLSQTMGTGEGASDMPPDLPWDFRFDMPFESRGPVLTTSGTLASNGQGPDPTASTFSRFDFGQEASDSLFSPDGSGIPSIPSQADEFPLFSLLTDYDQMQNPYAMGMT